MSNPNIAQESLKAGTRFPKGYKSGNHTQKGPYFTPLLKRFLEKKINFEDPDTHKIIHGKVKDAIIWRLILNATEGDNIAIREVMDRIDGKVKEQIEVDPGDFLKELLEIIPTQEDKKIKERMSKFIMN